MVLFYAGDDFKDKKLPKNQIGVIEDVHTIQIREIKEDIGLKRKGTASISKGTASIEQ